MADVSARKSAAVLAVQNLGEQLFGGPRADKIRFSFKGVAFAEHRLPLRVGKPLGVSHESPTAGPLRVPSATPDVVEQGTSLNPEPPIADST